MKFEKHVFISYGHIDNMATSGDEQGWVTRFYKDLGVYLSTNLGKSAEIWLDDQLQGNSVFGSEIIKQFSSTAALVTVLSARYLTSEWCKKELETFCTVAKDNGGLVIQDKTRVLKVLLKPIDSSVRNTLPSVLRDALGYDFYVEIEGNRTLPLDPKFGNEQAYNRKVYLLAEDVAALVQQLELPPSSGAASGIAPGPAASNGTVKPVVYLAECSYDRAEDRQKLRDELQANGYTVLPDPEQHLPDLDTQYVAEVGRLLSQCQLAIHMIGAFPGKIPDGPSGKSAVRLQNEVAAKASAEKGLERIIWMPQSSGGGEGKPSSNFLDLLTKDSDLQRGADLMVGGFEELKSAVRSSLRKIEEPAKCDLVEEAVSGGGIYLICTDEDLDAISCLTDWLSSKGYSVDLPVFSGDAAEVRQANEALAMNCDAVILFCGTGDGAWIFHQQNELKRVAALRRDKPWKALSIYLAGPATTDKRALLLKKPPHLVNAMDGFAPEKVQPLIDSLRVQ